MEKTFALNYGQLWTEKTIMNKVQMSLGIINKTVDDIDEQIKRGGNLKILFALRAHLLNQRELIISGEIYAKTIIR